MTRGLYAKDTKVSVYKSRMEIEQTLERYGARGFAYFDRDGRSVVLFEVDGMTVRFDVSTPGVDDFLITPAGRRRTRAAARHAAEQAHRQRWRALALAIKARLELVELGVTTFRREFFGQAVLPGGETLAEWAEDQLGDGSLPPLPMLGD